MALSRRIAATPRVLIAGVALAGLVSAGAAHLLDARPAARVVLLVTLLAGGVPLVAATLAGLVRGRFAADVVATLAIVGAAALGEYFAGVVIVLMQAGGEALEAWAMGRASRALEALLLRAPRLAHRRDGAGVTDVPAEAIVPGVLLVLRPGDMIPVDCEVTDGRSHVDASALTGEPAPVAVAAGSLLLSGAMNLEGALEARAVRIAGDSQYQQIVRLVAAAQADKAPIQRLADRYALWFTPVTLVMCGLAYLVAGDPRSVLAVLVVATPCPLILATPVAVIAGIGRAARRGIIVRNGGALETVGRAAAVAFDKTGTLTLGELEVLDVVPANGDSGAVLRAAAAVEELSSHHLARAIVREARRRFGALPSAAEFREVAGLGAAAVVEGRHVTVGARRWVGCHDADVPEDDPALTVAWVCIDGRLAGRIRFGDRVRDNAAALVRDLAGMGIGSTLLTGDRRAAAEAVAAATGITAVRAELLPAEKVAAVGELRRRWGTVVMVGDGINDAPALAAASAGIAMGAHAPAAAAAAADIVLLADDVGRVGETIAIGRRTRRIALQSIGVGLGVSGLLMAVAAFGYIPPALGAVLQEALDIGVILNALRAR